MEPIQYFNRYTGQIETEQVFGEQWLAWAYGTPLGRLTVELAAKRVWFSRWYGWKMSRRTSASRVFPFIKQYGLDIAEFRKPPDYFASFNDFFTRQLKDEARPIDNDPASVVFPADGRHLGWADSSAVNQVFVKGQSFDLDALLGDSALASKFRGGALVLSRLCPTDYHRFHFPAEGVPDAPRQSPRTIPGPLYSVNPVALRQRIEIFWTNRRVVTIHHSENHGDIALIEVGATCVGSIQQTHVPGQWTAKGGEKGYFAFGGSSTITLFEPGKIVLDEDLRAHTAAGRELYARMGDRMGQSA
ncbi:archaetidylserine decarboxylase [Cerasicoccus arenae]|uniref:phosphatidylserine decarboxylase n=1 Tax=Cerasicoccus arenae TaxID=424488 RepID=A0A8J3DEG7_9BACT|nr:archaetidylserine decarboxylase [Cerasicoccus arenae]MBK1856826.1 phosphatidylserine decarboxylase [Cerasicoccus arenae]GHC11111.1 phosphatidylserine decarboxylase proenzyme [Cerasicoccus arenae]